MFFGGGSGGDRGGSGDWGVERGRECEATGRVGEGLHTNISLRIHTEAEIQHGIIGRNGKDKHKYSLRPFSTP